MREILWSGYEPPYTCYRQAYAHRRGARTNGSTHTVSTRKPEANSERAATRKPRKKILAANPMLIMHHAAGTEQF
jgi:hypothetical protein